MPHLEHLSASNDVMRQRAHMHHSLAGVPRGSGSGSSAVSLAEPLTPSIEDAVVPLLRPTSRLSERPHVSRISATTNVTAVMRSPAQGTRSFDHHDHHDDVVGSFNDEMI